MTADDLPAAFAGVPRAWRTAMPGWSTEAERAVAHNVRVVSGEREIAPRDPFRALRFGAPADVKAVIFGQDPYPVAGHADGLAFSAGRGKPHSLRRIFEVLAADRPGFQRPEVWALDGWARQGVLMLNPVLSVEVGRAGSHLHCGWQRLTSEVVKLLCRRASPPTFLLWGKPANAFFDSARPPDTAPTVLRTRHPAHDIRREFMATGSHFEATADRIDWWAIGDSRSAEAPGSGPAAANDADDFRPELG